ncbi:hypothetical protein ACWXVL_02900 [Mycoplasma sp. 128]
MEKNPKLQQLEQSNTELQQENSQLKQKNSELQKQIETLNTTISENTKEINRLKGENKELNLYILDYQDWQKFSEAKKFIEKFNNILVFSKQYLEFLQGDEVINWERPNIRQGEYHSWNTPNTEFFKQVEKGQKDFDSLFSDIDLTNKAKVTIVRSLKPDNYMLNWNLLKKDFEKLKKLQTLKKVKELTSRQRTNSEKQEMKQLVWTIDNVYKQVNLVDLTTEVSVPFSTPWYENREEMLYAIGVAQDNYGAMSGADISGNGKNDYIERELSVLGLENVKEALRNLYKKVKKDVENGIYELMRYETSPPRTYASNALQLQSEILRIDSQIWLEKEAIAFLSMCDLLRRVNQALSYYKGNN